MDERKLSELLRDAVADAPAPTFDQNDVVRASERQRLRQRNRILSGSALGVALMAGATALSVALWTAAHSADRSDAAEGVAAPGNESTAPYELNEEKDAEARAQSDGGGGDPNSSPESRKQGRTPGEDAGPAGPGSTSSRCEQADRELAAALAGELPAAALSEQPLPTAYLCGQSDTSVTYDLPDGSVVATLVPPNSMSAIGQEPGTELARADAPAPDGSTVVIVSTAPAGGTPPYADHLHEWARGVAEGY